MTAAHSLDVFFGRGNDDNPFWLLAVRLDILLLVACVAFLSYERLRRRARGTGSLAACGAWTGSEIGLAAALTLLGGALRFCVEHNLTALGGIGYSRILLGYRGHFGTAQLYSLIYARAGRGLEIAIFLNRIASTLSVPLLFALCRRLAPARRAFPPLAALLLALHPLHLLFTPTDGLPISSTFLALASYLWLVSAVENSHAPARRHAIAAVAAAASLALVTQVRLENVLFVVPAAAYVGSQRRRCQWEVLLPASIVLGVFLAFYGFAALGGERFAPSSTGLANGLRTTAGIVGGDSMFALVPLAVGSLAAFGLGRGYGRWLAPLPLLAIVPVVGLAIALERHDHASDVVGLVRVYVNALMPPVLAAAYGLGLLWDTRRLAARLVVAVCVLWTAALPLRFWPHLRERHLEIAEHDLFRAAVKTLPPEIDRIVVPDDEILSRQSSSTIELLHKYRMIAAAAARPGVNIVGLTGFIERPQDIDCSRGNCAFFRGAPCTGGRRYWFAEPQCAALDATPLGPALREEEVVAGPYLDCALFRGELRERLCEPLRKRRRLGLYRLPAR